MATIRIEWFNPVNDHCDQPMPELIDHEDAFVAKLGGRFLQVVANEGGETHWYDSDRIVRVWRLG